MVCFHSIDDSVGRTKNRLIDDEAEESGSDINSDDDNYGYLKFIYLIVDLQFLV